MNNTKHEDISKLTSAFERFTSITLSLQEEYRSLKDNFQNIDLQLNATNNYLKSILINIPSGIIFINKKGIITTFNRAAAEILGHPKQEVLNKTFIELFSDKFLGFSITTAMKEKQAFSGHHINHLIEGENKELEISTNYIEQENPEDDGLIVVIRDVTEIRRLQTQANRRNRIQELGELAAAMAHEIRNPLGGIKGFASLLARDLESSPKHKAMAEHIMSGTERLEKLVNNVLHYARKTKLELVNTSLNDIICDLQQLINADDQLSEKAEITCKIPNKHIYSSLDREMFKGALLNIILNGIQAIEEKGNVTISLNQNEHNAIIKINDTGCGIPKEIQEKIYSPFFSTKETGNGFGLSEVHKTVIAHGGTIELTSKPGNTTFTIKIPKTRNSQCL